MIAEGTSIAGGRYVLRTLLGSGGMGAVWLATDERLMRDVAIKLVAEAPASDPNWPLRFKREAQAAASLSHPNIVRVFDYDAGEDGRPYLVMEYLSGGTLTQRLADSVRRPLDTRVLAEAVLGALAHLHAAGLVHRDIKPDNVLLDDEGRPHLTDFGIARRSHDPGLTSTGLVIGTHRYLAPEVLDGAPADARSDLYSAGVLLRTAGVSGAVVDRLTAAAPQQRPESADEALALLDAPDSVAAAPTAVHAPAAEPTGATSVQKAADPAARRFWVAAYGSAALAVVLALVLAATHGGPARTADTQARPRATLSVPSADAPLSTQLSALRRLVRSASR